MTVSAPSAAACVIAVVIPRSLKDPVGFSPSYLRKRSTPKEAPRRGAGMRGVFPSKSVTGGTALDMFMRSPKAAINPLQTMQYYDWDEVNDA